MKYHQQMRTDLTYEGLRRGAIAAVAAVVMFALVPAGAVSAKPKQKHGPKNATVVVTNKDLENSKVAAATNKKWFFYNDENDTVDNTLGSFVEGPGDAPEGEGSVQIGVSGTQRRNLATYQFAGTALEDITALKYSTYNASATNPGSVNRSGYLQFNVSFDGSDDWQRRLVHLPSDNGTVQQNTWQEWDGVNGGNALWRYSGPTWPISGEPGSTPKTWSQILAQYPVVQVRDTDAFMGIRVGEPYADGYVENLDAFVFGTAAKTTTFDFEPARTPSDKRQCKQDGWRAFNEPSFKNQGECVKFVKNSHVNDDDDHDHNHGQPGWSNAGLGGILTYLKFKFSQFFGW